MGTNKGGYFWATQPGELDMIIEFLKDREASYRGSRKGLEKAQKKLLNGKTK